MKDHRGDSETRDSASTNETNFKILERKIEEVALGLKDPTPKIGGVVSSFIVQVLEHLFP